MNQPSDRDRVFMHLQIDPDRITYNGPQTDFSISELTALYREHSRQQRLNRLWQGLSVVVPWLLGLMVVAIAALYVPTALLSAIRPPSHQLRR